MYLHCCTILCSPFTHTTYMQLSYRLVLGLALAGLSLQAHARSPHRAGMAATFIQSVARVSAQRACSVRS